jgi:hypothetical protein
MWRRSGRRWHGRPHDRTQHWGNGNGNGNGGRGRASRSLEALKLVFEPNKGAIYAFYNRALRDELGLQGRVVLGLKIAPPGQVERPVIASGELMAEKLEKRLLPHIRKFDFIVQDANVMVVTWPVDFLPS